MYGAVPAIFKNLSAAILTARGYSIEEKRPYTVMTKTTDIGETWYQPVAERDVDRAHLDGYSICVSAKCIEDTEETTEWDDIVWDPTLQDFKVTH